MGFTSPLASYRAALGVPGVAPTLALGWATRIPFFALPPMLTVHVTRSLGGSYSQAGVVGMVFTVGVAVAAPWWGRWLDRFSLRQILLPLTVASVVVWSWTPWASYGSLLLLVLVGSLVALPYTAVARQALMAVTTGRERRSAFAVDSVGVELAFALGPAGAIACTAWWSTGWVIAGSQFLLAMFAMVWWWWNPPLRPASESSAPSASDAAWVPGQGEPHGSWSLQWWRRVRRQRAMISVLVVSFGAVLVLAGTEMSLIRFFDGEAQKGWLAFSLIAWSAGSALGGFLYGGFSAHPSPVVMLLALVVITLPLTLAHSTAMVIVLVCVAGALCAPTLIRTVEVVGDLAPERRRGEALGWHVSAITVGAAAAAPLAGWAIDHGGSSWGFGATCLAGIVCALSAAVVNGSKRPRERDTVDH